MEETAKPKRVMPVLTFSRVVGYIAPVSQFNVGKAQEFTDRKTYDVDASLARGEQRGPTGEASAG